MNVAMKELSVREAEQILIDRYIRPARKERLAYELSNEKKRYRALDRFCHGAQDLIDRRTIVMSGTGLLERSAFQKYIAARKGSGMILSPDPSIDGLSLPVTEGVNACMICLDAAVFVTEQFALVKEEAMKGGTGAYLLERGDNGN